MVKRWHNGRAGAMLVALLLVVFVAQAHAIRLVRYPYIQNVKGDSVVIVWTTDQRGDSVVEYGLTPQYEFIASGDLNTTKHVVTLTDLSPDTVYYYRVRTGTVASEGERFKTANPPENPYFKMVVFGDSGDCTLILPSIFQILLANRIRDLAPDLMLHVGDIVYQNGEQWGYDLCYFPIYRDTIKSVSLFPSPGNHDYHAPSFLAPYLENFYVPENVDNPAHAKRYYSFDYGNAHFIALDTELPPGGLADADQRRWLENDLARSTDAVWKFVYFHRPPFSSGDSGSSLSVRNVIAPLVEKYNVDVVFTGHDHNYERTLPILNNAASDNGVTYIVTGGGGALLSAVGHSDWTAFSGTFYHATEVQIEDQTLTLAPVEIDGRRQDGYTLVKGTLTGAVTNTRGNVLPNATLTVLLNGRQRAVTPGAGDGSFSVYLAEGVYDVMATTPGCQSQTQTGISVAGKDETRADFVLQCQ